MISFNESWTVGPQVSDIAKLGGTPDTTAVTLPHDALISTEHASGNSGEVGYFPSAAFQYGIDVPGYLHRSLLDNFEWGHREPTFGLVAVDRDTFVRTPKPSLAWLGGVARRRGTDL